MTKGNARNYVIVFAVAAIFAFIAFETLASRQDLSHTKSAEWVEKLCDRAPKNCEGYLQLGWILENPDVEKYLLNFLRVVRTSDPNLANELINDATESAKFFLFYKSAPAVEIKKINTIPWNEVPLAP